uniref:Uncharacterized protein n=1 Tax=Nelumbo nucifera TaxID=4432 RepID=A0A822YVJ1_NELNU|nr:TPA_asm: hypothetical protein HUJ06_007343 [Nelumbo nucifera]
MRRQNYEKRETGKVLSQTLLVAARPMADDGDEWLTQEDMVVESLIKGPVPPTGPSDCTNLHKKNGGYCPPINSKKFAGQAHVESLSLLPAEAIVVNLGDDAAFMGDKNID